MLQVFVDESGRGENASNPIFVMAGYAGSVRNWESAVDDLQTIMRRKPTLSYLKGVEAAALDHNFEGWTEPQRNAKLAQMIAVLRKNRMVAISCAVTYRDFNRILKTPKGLMKQPDAILFAHIVIWMLSSAFLKPSREKIELIFDKGLIPRRRNIEEAHKAITERLPKKWTDLLVGPPRFEDDRNFLALQMADLFAWHSRRDYIEQLNTRTNYKSQVWSALKTLDGKALLLRSPDLLEFRKRWEAKYLPALANSDGPAR